LLDLLTKLCHKKIMRKKNHQMRLQSIGEILLSVLKRRGLAAKIEENSFFKLWPQAVGPQIAQQTQPDSLRTGTLFVKTTSSIWVQQLHFMKEDIRGKLNNLAGKETVKEIRFSIGLEISKAKAATAAPGPTVRKLLLMERDKKMIAESTAKLADRELAAILKRVMQVEISRRRMRGQL
jgi:predicted nucleic acid-binding Zn ribbon protein